MFVQCNFECNLDFLCPSIIRGLSVICRLRFISESITFVLEIDFVSILLSFSCVQVDCGLISLNMSLVKRAWIIFLAVYSTLFRCVLFRSIPTHSERICCIVNCDRRVSSKKPRSASINGNRKIKQKSQFS